MVDRVEASKNLELLKANQTRLMNYNHIFSSHAFKQDCGAELKKIAYENARNKIWQLEGYLLKEKLHQAQ